MQPLGNRMLCTFSKSKVFENSVLRACPLQLTLTEGQECICRKRITLYKEMRVVTCTHPNDWRGQPIYDRAAVVKAVKEKVAKKRELKRKEKEGIGMADADTTTQAEGKKKKDVHAEFAVMTMDRKQAISVYNRVQDVMMFVNLMGKAIANSKMFGCANVDQGYVMALAIIIEGRSPIEFIRSYHMLGGKLTMRADAMLSELRNRGGSHDQVSRTGEQASIKLIDGKRQQLYSFSWAEAQAEDYVYISAAVGDAAKVKKRLTSGEINPAALKDNWSTPRRRAQMLWARTVSDGVRAFMPECCSGFYTPEEFDAPLDEDGNIIEGEFTTTPTYQKAKDAVDTKVEPVPDVAEETKPEQVKDEPKPEEVKPAEKKEPIGKAIAGAELGNAFIYPDVGDEQYKPFQDGLVACYKRIKEKYLLDEGHKNVLAKKKVNSVREMPLKDLHEMIMKLEDKMRANDPPLISETEYAISRSLRPGNP